MKLIKTTELNERQFAQIDKMWNDEYPAKLKDRFPILLEGVKWYRHFLAEDELNKDVMGWAVLFEKDGEIRFSIIVTSEFKGQKVGTKLVEQLKADCPVFYGWVIDHNNDLKLDGSKYCSPLRFYLNLGFEVLENQRIDNDMLKAVKIVWNANKRVL